MSDPHVTLPNELWHHIIALAVPPPSFDQLGQQRQHTLTRCARVCKTWSKALDMLYDQVTLATFAQVNAFCSMLAQTAHHPLRARRAERVRAARVGKMWDTMDRDQESRELDLGKLFKLCPRLESLFLSKLDGLRFIDPSWNSQTLRSMHICDCSISAFTPEDHATFVERFPRLINLTLVDADLRGGIDLPALSLFHPYFYRPSSPLRGVNLTRSHFRNVLSPTLRYLSVDSLPLPRWQAATDLTNASLDFFSCPAELLRPEGQLSNLPRTLRVLRLTSGHFFGSDFLTPFLSSTANHLSQLEELILPMRVSTGAAYGALKEWASESGIKITWERDEAGQGTLHDEPFWRVVERLEGQAEKQEKVA
ncbi:hypothetical protein JCM11641_006998 [Rhodosporidiobolus odoratus]